MSTWGRLGVWAPGENLLQFTMVFYTQGILYCTYIGTVQVHIAFLKFYMQKKQYYEQQVTAGMFQAQT